MSPIAACASVLHTCCLTPFSYRQPLPIGKGPPAGRGIGRRVHWQSLGTYETDYDLRRQKTALLVVVSPIRCDLLPAHESPYPPCPPSRWEGSSFCLRICLTYLLPNAILVSLAPSHREGGSFCLRICLACLLPDAILVSSAEVLLHEGAFERLEQRRAPLDAFLLAINTIHKIYKLHL